MKITITQYGNELTFTGREWKDRVYFTRDGAKTKGQVCWDKSNRQWIKVKYEFGDSIKAKIQEQL